MKQLISYLKSKFGKKPSNQRLSKELVEQAIKQDLANKEKFWKTEGERRRKVLQKSKSQFKEQLFKGINSSNPRFPFFFRIYYEEAIYNDVSDMLCDQNKEFQDSNIPLMAKIEFGAGGKNYALISVNKT
jgi:hypothetical protein